MVIQKRASILPYTGNGDRMLLMAFDTMLKMERDPERYAAPMRSETGTDYADKY